MTTTFLKSIVKLEELPTDEKPQVAFVGRSNVGKSSLLNNLTGQVGLAKVSAEPGRTQTLNLFSVDSRYYLVDLPGYGFAKTSKAKREGFGELIREYLWQTQALRLVLLIIDARIGPTDLDREMMEYLQSGSIPFSIIVNKIDKLSRTESDRLMRSLEANLPGVTLLFHSNVTGQGLGEIRQTIEQVVRRKAA